MNETCERCGPAVRAACRVDRVGELYLCGPCAKRLWPARCAQGWTIWLAHEAGARRTLRGGPRLPRPGGRRLGSNRDNSGGTAKCS